MFLLDFLNQGGLVKTYFFILFSTATLLIYGAQAKEQVEFMCTSFVPIDLRDAKYNEIITYIENNEDIEIESYRYDGVVLSTFGNTERWAKSLGADVIRRKFGFRFQGQSLKCEELEKLAE